MTPSRRWDPYRDSDPGDIPAYTTIEASHYLRLPENTVRAWAFGRTFPTQQGRARGSTPPLIGAADAGRCLLSFLNLLELHALRGIRRDHDIQMTRIRHAIDWLKGHYQSPHPLLDHAMETDGVDLFLRQYGDLINLSRDGQLAMKDVFEAHLRRIRRNEHGVPVQFFPFSRPVSSNPPHADALTDFEQPRSVSIDPRIAFGRPVLVGFRIPIVEIVERFTAGDPIAEIAADYECPPNAIEEAIRWEQAAA
jgi:uncharacterized protein (DUF433 family)